MQQDEINSAIFLSSTDELEVTGRDIVKQYFYNPDVGDG